jgi:hypothetical protein
MTPERSGTHYCLLTRQTVPTLLSGVRWFVNETYLKVSKPVGLRAPT